MTKKDQARLAKLMQAARDAAFEAAEAMDRGEVKEWARLQDRAQDLRAQQRRLKSMKVKRDQSLVKGRGSIALSLKRRETERSAD
jgi:hypothetical protein